MVPLGGRGPHHTRPSFPKRFPLGRRFFLMDPASAAIESATALSRIGAGVATVIVLGCWDYFRAWMRHKVRMWELEERKLEQDLVK